MGDSVQLVKQQVKQEADEKHRVYDKCDRL